MDAIACLESAEKLTVAILNSGTLTILEITKHVKIVQDLGHKVQTLNRLLACKIYTIELLEKRADTEWSESLVPVLKDSTLLDWCADNPLWASIVLAMDTVGYYRMHWVEAVLANGLWNLLDNVEDKASRLRLIALGARFIADMEHVPEALDRMCDEVKEQFGPVVRGCIKMMRGILGLASPTPGRASLSDVQYILPANASTSQLVLDLAGGPGRALISLLRKDKGIVWREAESQFQLTIGFAESIQSEYMQLEFQLGQVLQALQLKVKPHGVPIRKELLTESIVKTIMNLFEAYGKVFRYWEEGLREDALEEMTDLFNCLATNVFEYAHQNFEVSKDQVSWFAPMISALKLVLPCLKNELLLQAVADVALQCTAKVSNTNLEDVLDKLATSVDMHTFRQLVHLLMVRSQEDLPDALAARIRGLFWVIAGFCVGSDVCWEAGRNDDGTTCEDGFTLAAFYCSRMANVNDQVLFGTAMGAASKCVKSYDAVDPVAAPVTVFANVHQASTDAKLFKEAVTACKLEDPALGPISSNLQRKILPFVNEQMRRVLRPCIQSCLQGLADGVVESITLLNKSCCGVVGGLSWSVGKLDATSILDHAACTLLKFPAGNLDKLISDATEAHARLSDEIGRHTHLFGNNAWTLDLSDDKKKLLESLKELTLAASVTKIETKLVLTMQEPSHSSYKTRLEKYTAQIGAEGQKPFEQLIDKDLAALILPVLKKDKKPEKEKKNKKEKKEKKKAEAEAEESKKGKSASAKEADKKDKDKKEKKEKAAGKK